MGRETVHIECTWFYVLGGKAEDVSDIRSSNITIILMTWFIHTTASNTIPYKK